MARKHSAWGLGLHFLSTGGCSRTAAWQLLGTKEVFSLQFDLLLLEICPPLGRESYTESNPVPCAGLVGKPLRWRPQGTSLRGKPARSCPAERRCPAAPGSHPPSLCSHSAQHKLVLLDLPGSTGKVCMEREEITSSSKFILYDWAYLVATGLRGSKALRRLRVVTPMLTGCSLAAKPGPSSPSHGSRKQLEPRQSTFDWFPV